MYNTFIVILIIVALVVGLIGLSLTIALWFDQSLGKRFSWWKKHIVGDAPEDYDG